MTKQTKQKHTPTPWKLVFDKMPFHGEVYHRIKQDNDIELPIALLWEGGGTKGKPTQLANASFIVTACNNHDRIVEALNEATFMLQRILNGEDANDLIEDESIKSMIDQAKQALKKARG